MSLIKKIEPKELFVVLDKIRDSGLAFRSSLEDSCPNSRMVGLLINSFKKEDLEEIKDKFGRTLFDHAIMSKNDAVILSFLEREVSFEQYPQEIKWCFEQVKSESRDLDFFMFVKKSLMRINNEYKKDDKSSGVENLETRVCNVFFDEFIDYCTDLTDIKKKFVTNFFEKYKDEFKGFFINKFLNYRLDTKMDLFKFIASLYEKDGVDIKSEDVFGNYYASKAAYRKDLWISGEELNKFEIAIAFGFKFKNSNMLIMDKNKTLLSWVLLRALDTDNVHELKWAKLALSGVDTYLVSGDKQQEEQNLLVEELFEEVKKLRNIDDEFKESLFLEIGKYRIKMLESKLDSNPILSVVNKKIKI